LVRRFESSVPQVAKAITDQIWAEIAGYAGLKDASARAEVEEAAARNVAAFIKALGEGRDIPRRDIDALAVVGETRAFQGVPLEDVLRAFRMVGRVLWDHFAHELSGPEGPSMEVAIQLSGTLMRFTDELASAVAHHYSVAQRQIVRRQEGARREFLHDLLLGSYSAPDEMVERARLFGYDLARPYTGVVAVRDENGGGDDEVIVSRALDRLAETLRTAGQPMVDRRGGQTIGLIALASGSDLKASEIGRLIVEELGEGWRVGVGGPYPSLEGCRRTYLEAREALEIGTALDPHEHVYPFENYLLYRFLRSDSALVERFVEAVVGALIDHDRRRRSELIKTLDAYLSTDASAKEAGRRLYAHPHTVTYRLRQIERLTGRSLRDPEDKLHLHLAVKALRLIRGAAAAAAADEPPAALRASS
jgi:sugar diacid utilization regulator